MDSSVCQVRQRKRASEEEGDEENGVRFNSSSSIANRTIVTRSMSKGVEKVEGKKRVEGDLIEPKMGPDKDKLVDNEVVEEKKKKEDDDAMSFVSEDWPEQWNWELDLALPKGGYKWNSHWVDMDGEFWILRDKNNHPFWNEEPWNYDPEDDGRFSRRVR